MFERLPGSLHLHRADAPKSEGTAMGWRLVADSHQPCRYFNFFRTWRNIFLRLGSADGSCRQVIVDK